MTKKKEDYKKTPELYQNNKTKTGSLAQWHYTIVSVETAKKLANKP